MMVGSPADFSIHPAPVRDIHVVGVCGGDNYLLSRSVNLNLYQFRWPPVIAVLKAGEHQIVTIGREDRVLATGPAARISDPDRPIGARGLGEGRLIPDEK